MTRLQKIIVAGVLCNALILVLVPPYDVVAIDRRLLFDAFYPVFAVPPGRTLDVYILAHAFAGLGVNATLAWLMIGRTSGPAVSPRQFVAVLGVLNLLVVLTFPPFELYPFPPALTLGYFDGFHLVFGERAGRDIYAPLLTLEVIYVALNALAFWVLVGRRPPEKTDDPGPRTMIQEAAGLIEAAREKIVAEQKRRAESGKDGSAPG